MRSTLTVLLAVGALACSSPDTEQPPKPVAPPKDAARPVSALPEGWRARLDDPLAKDSGTVQLEKDAIMFAGGPGGIYYKPGDKAEKDYTVRGALTQTKTFPAPQPYGLFVSGIDLETDNYSYTAFVVRQDAKFRIVNITAGKETVLVDWRTAKPMVEPKGVKPTNTLEIRALQGGVHFLIGDTEVHQMPREKVGADGIAGVKLGPGLTVQVTRLEIKKFP